MTPAWWFGDPGSSPLLANCFLTSEKKMFKCDFYIMYEK